MSSGFRLQKVYAHRCLRQCHPGPYPSCSQKYESYCLCKRSRKNIPCLLVNAPVLYHKHFFYKNSAKHKNALPIALIDCHVTCLSFSAWQCNRRCMLILDCGKHQCKKTCCTKLKPVFHSLHSSFGCRVQSCNRPCHPGRCYPCELELVYYSVEQSGVCGKSGLKPNRLQLILTCKCINGKMAMKCN
ncbi:NF-X1-type zinc finger protein NFXL1 [Trichinella britovi]|uniref:NF-X1-type zinc finger protein NFXL1 n=1 Tax=Trichinella britovi TaxID=45882 RepID=A0A0V1DEB1_TRIBR|nr:NF-X1-type zinc finger protein NFXL1 [Trichinella britovi]